jgi:hypothetical protein
MGGLVKVDEYAVSMSRTPVPAVIPPMHQEIHADNKLGYWVYGENTRISCQYRAIHRERRVCAADLRRRANAGEAVSI